MMVRLSKTLNHRFAIPQPFSRALFRSTSSLLSKPPSEFAWLSNGNWGSLYRSSGGESNATSGLFLGLPSRWYYALDYGSQFRKDVPAVTLRRLATRLDRSPEWSSAISPGRTN